MYCIIWELILGINVGIKYLIFVSAKSMEECLAIWQINANKITVPHELTVVQ